MNEYFEYDVSIVLPCYQEEGHILESIKEIYKVINNTPYTFEIIFVDDASTDGTKEKILQLEKIYPDIRYVFHEKNVGRGGAFADGAKISRGKFIGYLDIDLEISAKYLPELLKELENENDVAIVGRSYKITYTLSFLLRHIASVLYQYLVNAVLGIPKMDTESGFKFFRRESLYLLLEKTKSQGWFFDTEIMALASKLKFRIKEVNGEHVRNTRKKSTVRIIPDSVSQFTELLKFRKRMKSIEHEPHS